MGWIVAIWVRLVRLIEEKGGLRFWKGGPIKKMKYVITKKILAKGGGGGSPLGPHLGLSLSQTLIYTLISIDFTLSLSFIYII